MIKIGKSFKTNKSVKEVNLAKKRKENIFHHLRACDLSHLIETVKLETMRQYHAIRIMAASFWNLNDEVLCKLYQILWDNCLVTVYYCDGLLA